MECLIFESYHNVEDTQSYIAPETMLAKKAVLLESLKYLMRTQSCEFWSMPLLALLIFVREIINPTIP